MCFHAYLSQGSFSKYYLNVLTLAGVRRVIVQWGDKRVFIFCASFSLAFTHMCLYVFFSCCRICCIHELRICVRTFRSVFQHFCHFQSPALALSPVRLSVPEQRESALKRGVRFSTNVPATVIWWLFTTSTANWVPNCFCGVRYGSCSIWFEAGKDRAGGLLTGNCVSMLVHVCAHACVNKEIP